MTVEGKNLRIMSYRGKKMLEEFIFTHGPPADLLSIWRLLANHFRSSGSNRHEGTQEDVKGHYMNAESKAKWSKDAERYRCD